MSGVNALSSTKDAQIAALTAQVVAPRWCARSRGGNSAGDSRPYPPAIPMDVRRQRLTNGHCERCDADPSHRWNDCRYQNFQSSPTVSDPRRANVNNIAATGWAEANHVVYKAGKRQLRTGNGPTRINVCEADWKNRPAVRGRTKHIRDTTVVSARVFKALAERPHHREEAIQLCSVSISDINKALDKLAESKQPMAVTEIRAELPHQLHSDVAPA
ncbi:uncharacterized protein CPUR_04673 [Claviceps purpurea 20.1]|uniref:Uncharacterized protein n=1 Tax=Claviceps purpurea (strain 20.1) TaxID=1111077 RepID=M1WFC2_CLAP2|nr:uncharacterized protein CPUR_04673 [Claviceps purpurea 20.1]